uniref:Uncharacterized protein n=1 Tax=Glossina austeni TaxID=7395 RepID=A0A1A9UIP4_GLOAU
MAFDPNIWLSERFIPKLVTSDNKLLRRRYSLLCLSLHEYQKLLPMSMMAKSLYSEAILIIIHANADNMLLEARHIVTPLNNFPSTLHSMVQVSAAVTALNHDTKLAKVY